LWWLICAALLSPHLLPNFLAASPILGLDFLFAGFRVVQHFCNQCDVVHQLITGLGSGADAFQLCPYIVQCGFQRFE
jgi:hypothetical protein